MSRKQRFVALVVLCGVLGLMVAMVELWNCVAAGRQADAVSRIETKGGRLHREWPGNVEVVEAVFIGPQFTDEDVMLLRYFPALRVVALLRTSATAEAHQAFQHERPDVTVVVEN